jgi:hypothetical protein
MYLVEKYFINISFILVIKLFSKKLENSFPFNLVSPKNIDLLITIIKTFSQKSKKCPSTLVQIAPI